MGINGTHMLLYSSQPDELRAVLSDVFGFDHVVAHDTWLIYALPPAELGVHPGDSPSHQITFMCEDIHATIADLQAKGIVFDGEPESVGFGIATTMVLPGDVRVMLYEPRHPTVI